VADLSRPQHDLGHGGPGGPAPPRPRGHGPDQSYIDQGKEPPPELLKLLDVKDSVYGNRGASRSAWPGVFLFAALCAGFLMFAHWPGGLDFEPRQIAALHFVALIMGGLCLGCLVMTLRSERDRNPRP
jgi:hypothetical protein